MKHAAGGEESSAAAEVLNAVAVMNAWLCCVQLAVATRGPGGSVGEERNSSCLYLCTLKDLSRRQDLTLNCPFGHDRSLQGAGVG